MAPNRGARLMVGDKVLLDAADPRITIPEPNEEIPLTVLSTFPYGIVEFLTSTILNKSWNAGLLKPTRPGTWACIRPYENRARFFSNRGCDKVATTVQYGRWQNCQNNTGVRHCQNQYVHGPMYTGVGEANEARHIRGHPHTQRTRECAECTMLSSRGKKIAVPVSKKRKRAVSSSGLTTEIRHPFLQSMVNGHVIDLAYFIALAIRHQMERHRRGVISIGPYVTQLARHFRLLNIAAQSSSLTLIGQMSLQGISSVLSMRMIEKQRGTYPPQYRLV
ncbi:hypothetical protein GOBAR_AA12533 [Gossypium barbadense]|uniref:Uncharacterized protein n=1 Tax=Gossypium barbadense TaxID=3634 RepID=A0A2P5XXN6_GOSBA|nr:hypothetical protein GOBAR_AA12533 [Gossypium barbadense]